jgi:hypothetical protein
VNANLEGTAESIREVLQVAPIRHVRDTNQFCNLEGMVGALPALGGLRGLEFWSLYGFDDELMRQILTSPHLANLRVLILAHDRNGNLTEDNVIIEAVGSPYRANLRWLEVNVDSMWRGPSEEILRAMGASPYLQRVRKLNLSETTLTLELFAGLLRAMPRLERINFHDAKAPLPVWEMVLERARQRKLKWLCLSDARIGEPGEDGGDDLSDHRDFRRGKFKPLGVRVDWYSEFIDPWNGGCWEGHSWDGLRTRHALATGPFVSAGNWDGLAATYRADCVKFAGEEMAARIDALPFATFEADLLPALRRAVEVLGTLPTAKALHLFNEYAGLYPGRFKFTADDPGDRTYPHETSWGVTELATEEIAGPTVAGVGDITGLHERTLPLDPAAASHYLMALALRSIARVLARQPVPVPFIVRWDRVVFRM